MNHGADNDNDDDMSLDYYDDTEGNDDDDDDNKFVKFDDGDDMYDVSIQDVRRSQTNVCNDEVECSVESHDSIDIEAYTSHILNPNLFFGF